MMRERIKVLKEYISNLKSSSFFRVFLFDVFTKGADYIILPVYLQLFSQQEYGFYTYTLYVITTISGILKLGLDTALSKMYYETDKYDRKGMLFSLTSIWLLFFLVLSVFLLSTDFDIYIFTKLLFISDHDYSIIRYFIFVFILFNLIQNTLNVFFVIGNNILSFQKYNLIRIVLSNIIIIVILKFCSFENKAYIRIIYEPILFLFFFTPLIFAFIKNWRIKIEKNAILHGFSIGLPMVGSLLVGVVYNISDKYFLQKSSGFEILATYNLAIFLSLPISLIFMSFNTVWLPKFFQEKSMVKNFNESNKYVVLFIKGYCIILIIMALVIFCAIKVNLIKNDYSNLIFIFPLIFLAKISESLIHLYNNFVVIWNKASFNLYTSIAFGIITFVLNWLVIPIFGLYGATFILLFIGILRLLLFYYYVKIKIESR